MPPKKKQSPGESSRPQRASVLRNLPPDAVLRVAGHLGRRNLASLRSASRGTRNFGTGGRECASELQNHPMKLVVQGEAVARSGAPYRFNIDLELVTTYREGFVTHSVEVRGFRRMAGDLDFTIIVTGAITGNRVSLVWRPVGPEGYIRDQIVTCIVRECNRHAHQLVGRYNAALAGVPVQTSPSTAAGIRSAFRNVVVVQG